MQMSPPQPFLVGETGVSGRKNREEGGGGGGGRSPHKNIRWRDAFSPFFLLLFLRERERKKMGGNVDNGVEYDSFAASHFPFFPSIGRIVVSPKMYSKIE